MFKLLAVFVVLYGINAQIIVPRKCPDLGVQEDFVLDRFAGLWYEQEKYPVNWEENGSCITHEYTKISDREINVHIEQLYGTTGVIRIIEGSARLDGKIDEAKFTVNLPVGPVSPYWVLGVDYEDVAVVWSCVQLNETAAAESAWILGREKQVDAAVLEKAYNIFDRENISRAELVKTIQDNC
ncbi:hypothetical protein WA026_002456 [Henosepilachna vigintioctopunctata]|uniref:Apolipoprotein D n=1 Tax=Henosepilachna vigintioctopunctata TaxID=420089 RepID=A0AAW1U0F0_9CUCU